MKNLKLIKLLSALMVLIGTQQAVVADQSEKNRAEAQSLIKEAEIIKNKWQATDTSSNKEASDFKKWNSYALDAVFQYCKWSEGRPDLSQYQERCELAGSEMREKWKRLSALLDGTAKPPVDDATQMKICYTLPINLIWKGNFLDRGCTKFVDKYGQIRQEEVEKVKQDKSLSSELLKTPLYIKENYEWHYDRDRDPDDSSGRQSLCAKLIFMEEESTKQLYKKFWESDFECKQTATKIDEAFKKAEK
jgi:hypothetical protein